MPYSNCQTLSYSEDAKGWPSFYSYCADWLLGMNSYFYTWSGGNLWRHNTNPIRNSYYGTLYSSNITGVFNVEPKTIKLFKTMSFESDDSWTCTALATDLSNGSMLNTWFVEKEGEWFTFLRENTGTLDWRDRSANGIGAANTVVGPVAAVMIDFTVDVGTIIKARTPPDIGDAVYFGTIPTFAGFAIAVVPFETITPLGVVTLASITVDCTTGAVPAPGDFILFIKDAVSESHGARGYFMEFTISNSNTNPVELFSVGSSVMKSYP